MLFLTYKYIKFVFFIFIFRNFNLTISINIKTNKTHCRNIGILNNKLLFIRTPRNRFLTAGFLNPFVYKTSFDFDSLNDLESLDHFVKTKAKNKNFGYENDFVDYYRILSLDKSCSHEDIENKYNNINESLNTLPSVDPKLRSDIDLAYKVLSDETSRKDYDKLYDDYNSINNQYLVDSQFDSEDFEDEPSGEIEISIINDDDSPEFSLGSGKNLFGNFFTNLFGLNKPTVKRTKQSKFRTNSRLDLTCEADVDLKTLLMGGNVSIPVHKWENCNFCNYNDDSMNEFIDQCNVCKGEGMETKEKRTKNGFFRSSRTCTKCRGTGYQRLKDCNKCDNTGRVLKDTTIKINVPFNSKSGSTLRIRGMGHSGGFHLRDGDLYVKLNLKSTNEEYIDGNRIVSICKIPYTKAILGGKINVTTFNGELELEIPSCSQQGDEIKVGRYNNMNHYVKLNVQLPKTLTKNQKDLLGKIDES
ncbi:chaperone protein DnaJ, putative [Theileria annulata]|uniref:Chaperone protein DnaJ, putative n=1 Tax=Theileria annulata TaxID=5874 RepID=Q4UDY3_THEAN|nr:chaperone protein DnaJ, putative [Theileria annulata]CAI74706.1 chaperone protein DnaJ, putative [Theileria annulata]|eukprot:XP_952438.1 chaperone protein DnaJ, putative [Theileria annulata]